MRSKYPTRAVLDDAIRSIVPPAFAPPVRLPVEEDHYCSFTHHPAFKLGDQVYTLICGEVTRGYQDCDGAALFELDGELSGYNNSALAPASESPVSAGFPEELTVNHLFAEIQCLREAARAAAEALDADPAVLEYHPHIAAALDALREVMPQLEDGEAE